MSITWKQTATGEREYDVRVEEQSLAKVLEKVGAVVGRKPSEVLLTYVDEDGDRVSVKSEAEWRCALASTAPLLFSLALAQHPDTILASFSIAPPAPASTAPTSPIPIPNPAEPTEPTPEQPTPGEPTSAPPVATPKEWAAKTCSKPAVHAAVCDFCGCHIVGKRIRCVACRDFDFCEGCNQKYLDREFDHLPGHTFVSISHPGSEPVPLPARDQQPKCPVTATKPNPRNLYNRFFSRYFCDACRSQIVGDRHHCQQCPDFDFCGSCFAGLNAGNLHHITGHTFQGFKMDGSQITTTPKDAKESVEQEKVAEKIDEAPKEEAQAAAPTVEKKQEQAKAGPMHHAICDKCGKFIRGSRFKCVNCPDFDLCEICQNLFEAEAEKAEKEGVQKEGKVIHDHTHVFMKFRRPMQVPMREAFTPMPSFYRGKSSPVSFAEQFSSVSQQLRRLQRAHRQEVQNAERRLREASQKHAELIAQTEQAHEDKLRQFQQQLQELQETREAKRVAEEEAKRVAEQEEEAKRVAEQEASRVAAQFQQVPSVHEEEEGELAKLRVKYASELQTLKDMGFVNNDDEDAKCLFMLSYNKGDISKVIDALTGTAPAPNFNLIQRILGGRRS